MRSSSSIISAIVVCGFAVSGFHSAQAQTSRGSVETMQHTEHREALQRAFAEAPQPAHERRDVVWATAGEEELAADLFWPDGDGPHPIVVWIHGGGFRGGFKELGEFACRTFAANGYVAMNINYRLAPEHKFPAAVNDCLGAIVWIKKNAAEFNGDPERIAVAGESAGGNLSAMVAYAAEDNRWKPTGAQTGDPKPIVNVAIPVYGVFDFSALEGNRRDQILDTYLASRDDLAAASPLNYVTPQSVPTLLVVGDADSLYPESTKLKQRLEELQVPHDMLVADGADHAFIIWEWDQPNSKLAHKAMLAFLNEHLKSPPPLKLTAWSGTWLPERDPENCGELECKARLLPNGKWEATFRGYCNRQFLYEVKMTGREQNGEVKFEGEADLGPREGIYKWTGKIAEGQFTGIWQSKNKPAKKGTFEMQQAAAP